MEKNPQYISVVIDPNAGFCFGVVNVIEIAEEYLKDHEYLYCLGNIVHNQAEMKRLEKKGLRVIDHNKFRQLKGENVLIRAHGEPQETYRIAEQNNIHIIEGTCPIVIKLQKNIRKQSENAENLQIVIFGKPGHPEAIGLVSQFPGKVRIGEDASEIDLDYCAPVRIYSQTTMDAELYSEFCGEIYRKATRECESPDVVVQKSVCGQVANRAKSLREFATDHDVIVFVSGKNSSNGNFLFWVAQSVNSRTFFVSKPSEIDPVWFDNVQSIGISGATSTPVWLMREVKRQVEILF